MDNPYIFTSAEALRFGWQQTRAHLKSLLPIAFFAAFLALVQRAIQGQPTVARGLAATLIDLVQVGVTMTWTLAALRLHDGQPFDWNELAKRLDGYLSFLVTAVLYGLIVAGGLILFIVPGVYWAVKYAFATFLVVDRQLDPLTAIRESGRITDGQRGRLLWFGLALLGINILGAIAFGVGLFLTIPTSYIAAAYVFRRLEAHAPVHIDAGTPSPVH
jgi:uncharacterized membrane protein